MMVRGRNEAIGRIMADTLSTDRIAVDCGNICCANQSGGAASNSSNGWRNETYNLAAECWSHVLGLHVDTHLSAISSAGNILCKLKIFYRRATLPVHTAMYNELQAAIPPASQALLQSQAGPFASRAFTTIPYSTEFECPSHLFRILLRRLRLHLPLSARSCRCRRPLDPFGDHRAACAQSGVLRARGGPLERAAARICREGGARVTTNTRLADLNIQNLSRVDDRRREVIANGLPMWGGSQLAVDTTLVSPLTRSGEPRSRGGTYAGAALQDARRNKERTYPELLPNRRCRLVVLGIEVGGRWSNEASNFVRMLANARARSSPPLHSKQPPVRRWWPGGPLSSPTPQRRPSLPACCLKTSLPTTTWTEISQPSATSLPTPAPPCQPVACQPGSGRSGLIPSLPQAHLETGQYKNSLCLETAQ